jgi:hypothetical protein
MAGTRDVAPPPALETEVIAEIEAAPTACVDAVDFLLEELERQDPDPDERCGMLGGRHEVYALRLPRCARLRLLVAIDRRGGASGPCAVLGLAPSTARPCEIGRRRAEAHLAAINPVWEPAR